MSDITAGLIIFDLEGTLITPYMQNPDKDYHRWQLMPGRAERLQALHAEGWTLAVVTNQAGVAFGHIVEADFERKLTEVRRLLAVPFDCRVCFCHPRATISAYRDFAGVLRRKPGGAMLAELLVAHREAAHINALYIGDGEEDQEAARHAGVRFIWAWDYFGDEGGGVTYYLPEERVF